MINKIVFFNHYHRGDIFTHRGFIQHLQKLLPNIKFEYLHFNHPKLTRDLEIPLVGDPSRFSKKLRYQKEGSILYINTWVGAYSKLFKIYKGLNMNFLMHQWKEIFSFIENEMKCNIFMKKKEDYLPSIDFNYYDTSKIDSFFLNYQNKKSVLLCNGSPKSKQSFLYNMASYIISIAKKYPDCIFICTEKFENSQDNIFFTDDIIKCSEEESKRAPWEDMSKNICDLPEISYISEKVNLIVGKNSGPFCFCETRNNYLNLNKNFLSFNVSWGMGTPDTESMSHDLNLLANYNIIMIDNVENLSASDEIKIIKSLEEQTRSLYCN